MGFEANQSNPVIIICNDAHRFIGNSENDRNYVNTLANNSNNKNGAKFEISIEFRKGAVQPKDLNINQLDVFVISKEADTKTKRIEIHVAGHCTFSEFYGYFKFSAVLVVAVICKGIDIIPVIF